MAREKRPIEKENITVSIYTPKDVWKFLTEQAKKEGRSMSNYCLRLFEAERERMKDNGQLAN